MRLENQVCTLEQAETLKIWGIEQASIATYHDLDKLGLQLFYTVQPPSTKSWSAFTGTELAQMLPNYSGARRMRNGKWYAIWCPPADTDIKSEYMPNQAQAMADLLIILLENGKMKVDEVNLNLLAES